MTQALLGTAVAGDAPIAVDLPELIGSHLGVVANSGGGKSGLLRRLLEQTHGQVLQIVLDAEDEFYTLREQHDYVIAGGAGGDAPATVEGAPRLARLALEHGFSLIAQINDLGEDAPAFVTAFLGGLMAAPADLWRPVLVVLDEAQRFCSRDSGAAAPAVRDLLFRGRKRGFTACLASLRMAEIDPGVRGMINNWLFGRVGQALDRRTVAQQLGFSQSDDRLIGMAKRTFWALGPALAAEPVLLRVGDVATTIVERGAAKPPTPPAPEALRELLGGLAAAAAPPAAAAYPDDTIPANPGEAFAKGGAVGGMLRERDERIADLEAANALLTETAAEAAVQRDCARRRLGEVGVAIDTAIDALQVARRKIDRELQTVDVDMHSSDAIMHPRDAKSAARREPPPAGDRAPRGRKALQALARIYPAALTEPQWATLAGYAKTGGTWGTYKGELMRGGLVERVGDLWRATAEGVAAAGVPAEPFPDPGPDLARAWAERIPGVRKMVETLIKRWPHFTTRDGLAADLGMSAAGGTFGTYLGRLRSNGLLEEQGKRIRLTTELMGEVR